MSIVCVVWGSDQEKEVRGTEVTFKQIKNHKVTITSIERNNKNHVLYLLLNQYRVT